MYICYFKKVDLLDLSSYGGNFIKFLLLKFKFHFPAKRTKVNKADFHKIISLLDKSVLQSSFEYPAESSRLARGKIAREIQIS